MTIIKKRKRLALKEFDSSQLLTKSDFNQYKDEQDLRWAANDENHKATEANFQELDGVVLTPDVPTDVGGGETAESVQF